MCALKVPILVQTSWRNLLRVKHDRQRASERTNEGESEREGEIVLIIIVIYYVEYASKRLRKTK